MNSEDTHTSKKTSARERILHTAHTLFYQNGIRATGVDKLIAQSSVTKTTFYRHFPSKNQLILAFLEYRHTLWMRWFIDTLNKHGNTIEAICPTCEEWFTSENFRGCAFINSVVEFGKELPEVVEITYRHKQDMVAVIAGLLVASNANPANAKVIALALDGAIIHAQFGEEPTSILAPLGVMIKAFSSSPAPRKPS